MKCLIVAAGRGSRLSTQASKPLADVLGTALIERVIGQFRRAGIEDFVVVTGFMAEALEAALPPIGARTGTRIETVRNEEWTRANGVSVAAARPLLNGAFLLSMCDHLLDPQIVAALCAAPCPPGGVTLAVDFDLDNVDVDLEDVTRVRCEGQAIRAIGKQLERYDGFDTGVFHCTQGMFAALAKAAGDGADSISDAMTRLCRQELAFAMPIGGRTWIDVDEPASLARAEALLRAGRL